MDFYSGLNSITDTVSSDFLSTLQMSSDFLSLKRTSCVSHFQITSQYTQCIPSNLPQSVASFISCVFLHSCHPATCFIQTSATYTCQHAQLPGSLQLLISSFFMFCCIFLIYVSYSPNPTKVKMLCKI